MEKIPYGVSNYRDLRLQNYIYIDKTRYIELLENYSEKYIFFLRPRRFGKTLFVSLLNYYYDKKYKSEFNQLFEDLYIGHNPTSLANSYYTLKFNFSKLNSETKEQLLESFTESMKAGLKDFEKKYNLELDYTRQGMPSDIFNAFLVDVQYKIDGKIYVLIDEYDHFANELLSFQIDTFNQVISKTGFVRKWYEALKVGTETIIDRIFATGVSPVTLDSLTSGFNIAKNKTRDKKLNEMMGFTRGELEVLLNKSLGDSLDSDELIPQLKNYYNGYLFNENAIERVFNSDMVLFYLTEFQANDNPPADLIDTNISSDYAKIRELFTLQNQERNLGILEDILSGKEQIAQITREFSLAKEFTSEDFLSLLFYLGFLTIDGAVLNRVNLTVPNYAIQELYFDCFAKIIKDRMDYQLDISKIKDSIAKIALDGEIDNLIQVVEQVLSKHSNRDFNHYDEKYIKLIFLSYLFLSKVYFVKSEYEVENGYIDIALLERSGVEPKYEAIIELKYIKKSDYDKKGQQLVNSKLAEGKKQILRYKESDELSQKDNLKKWVIVFAGSSCVGKLDL